MTELTIDEKNELRVSLIKHIESRLESIDKQIATSERVLNARLETMNEFRNSMRDQTSTYLTLKEYSAWRDKVEEQLQALREFRALINAKADQKAVTLYFIMSVASLLVSFIGLISALTR